MKWYKGLVAAAVLTFLAVGCGGEQQAQESGSSNGGTILQAQLPAEDEEIAVITTSMGDITLRLYPEEAPKAVENFKTLAKDGYYDGVIFHRVIEDFMIQTGDPSSSIPPAQAQAAKAAGERISRTKYPKSSTSIAARWQWQTAGRIPTAASSSSYSRRT